MSKLDEIRIQKTYFDYISFTLLIAAFVLVILGSSNSLIISSMYLGSMLLALFAKKTESMAIFWGLALVFLISSVTNKSENLYMGGWIYSKMLIHLIFLIYTMIISYRLFSNLGSSRNKLLRKNVRILLSLLTCIILVAITIAFSAEIFYDIATHFDSENIGIKNDISLITDRVDFYYFSFATYFTIGYGDLSPNDKTTKIVCMYEMGASYLISMFFLPLILSNLFLDEKEQYHNWLIH